VVQEAKDVRIIAIGEAMIELAREADGRFVLGFGGDTFNTAIYLARCGAATAYATALGQDSYSDAILERAAAEGIATNLVLRIADRNPGLYLIETDADGERRFHYWREASPARQLFELPGWDRIAEEIVAAQFIYLSGITLSLYSNIGLGRLLAALEFARERGARIALDSNWRPRNWRGDEQRARAVFGEALKRADLALPTFDDEAKLWGDGTPAATIERLTGFGVTEIVVKNGPKPAVILANGTTREVPVPRVMKPVDTTAAGDSFNAAFLAARLKGEDVETAVLAGHKLAAQVIGYRGAILPRPSGVAAKSRQSSAPSLT
jgi:2-dehydro-3-deoxygluconokinase